ncbi:MAG: glycosyltransferase [Candidatus Paceibacterota bacterium]
MNHPRETRGCAILQVANKKLPENDYRISYSAKSRFGRSKFILPGRPENLPREQFFRVGFGEGLGWRDVAHFVRLAKYLILHRRKHQLVHFFSTKLFLFGPWCARLAGMKYVATVTGFGRTFNRDRWLYRLLRPFYLLLAHHSCRHAEQIYFQNYGDLDWAREKFPRLAERMRWIGSGVDAASLRRTDYESRPLRILAVARLMPDKGITEYLAAADAARGTNMEFHLVGPPSDGQHFLLEQVRARHAKGTIRYHGELGAADLANVYARCHIFLFLSHGEGMSRAMLEAGFAGLCPLASDIPANRDLVRDGGGFLLARPASTTRILDLLQLLNGDRELLSDAARAYQRLVVTLYTTSAYRQRLDKSLVALDCVREPKNPFPSDASERLAPDGNRIFFKNAG